MCIWCILVSVCKIINKIYKTIFLYIIYVMWLPEGIWKIIKEYQIEYKKHHFIKMYKILNKFIKYRHGGEFYRWTHFPPWPNTNDMIREELYTYGWRSNLELTSITYNPNGNNNGGWWCGYGWKKFNNHIFNREFQEDNKENRIKYSLLF